MQLEDFFDYKNQFMQDILTTESIVELLDDDIPMNQAKTLVYKQVFPYEYIPETIEEGKTFVCCDVDIIKAPSSTFYVPVMYVWVFTHKSRMRLKKGGVVVDKLISEISKKVNGSFSYCMGTMDLYSVKRFAPLTDYQGKVMAFTGKEWNAPAPNKHPIPANRKTG